MKSFKSERGFMMIEMLVSLIIILAAAGALLLIARSGLVLEEDAARTQAIYISQGAIAEVEARVSAGELAAGDKLPLQSEANGVSFEGEASVEPYRDGLYLVTTRVAWESRAGEGEVRFERLVLSSAEQ